MILNDLLTPDAILAPLRGNGKKQVLQDIAERAATLTGLPDREVFDALLQRERLGSTGIGDGIAIPHGRSTALERLHGLFVKLDKPVDFDALDGQPVDILFVLLAPEGAGADHLKALARVARVLRDRVTLDRVRKANDADAIYAILTETAAKAA
jgi:nitrogen PTS system EIIA component